MSEDKIHVQVQSPVLEAAMRVFGCDLILRGVLEALAGLLLILRPVETAVFITVAVGVFLLIDGAILLVSGLRMPGSGGRWLTVNAALLLLLGAFAVWRPIMVDYLWVVILGIWQILGGVETLSGGRKSWNVFSGVLSLALGIVFIVSPFVGLFSIVWVIGALLLFSGAIRIVAGIRFRF